MWTTPRLCRRLRRCDEGATAIEYALFAALIAVVLVATLAALGGEVSELFVTVESDFDGINAVGAPPAAD